MRKVSQGTISVLFGCHSIFHSFLVLLSWKRLYGRWPEPWQVVCIFIHDVGHWGLNYLDSYELKKIHWYDGAMLGLVLFGQKAFNLIAGHDVNSGYRQSELYKPDKYSWTIAPKWWLYSNLLFEPKLANGMKWRDAIEDFQARVKASIDTGLFSETHLVYLDREAKRQV